MKKKFKRDIRSLENIFSFTDKFVSQNKLNDAVSFSINLVVEELFTNMVKYNPGNPNDIMISLSKNIDKLTLSITDYDVDPYNIELTEKYNSEQSLEERRIGGMGIHLVRKIANEIKYEYRNRESKITLTILLKK